jgi:hypothetical protein
MTDVEPLAAVEAEAVEEPAAAEPATPDPPPDNIAVVHVLPARYAVIVLPHG